MDANEREWGWRRKVCVCKYYILQYVIGNLQKIKMKNITKKQSEILRIISTYDAIRPKDIEIELKHTIKINMIQKHLSALLQIGAIERTGVVPNVFYRVPVSSKDSIEFENFLTAHQRTFINEYYSYEGPGGYEEGVAGFLTRFRLKIIKNMEENRSRRISDRTFADQIQKRFLKEVDDYLKIKSESLVLFGGKEYIDATARLHSIMKKNIAVNKVFYKDFYSIEHFGKTRLGCLISRAKIGDEISRKFVDQIIALTSPALLQIINEHSIDHVVFIPFSVKRRLQFMNLFRDGAALKLPHLEVHKVFRGQVVAQKSISGLADRIANARSTNIVTAGPSAMTPVQHLLIIDDAIGSGATVNEVAAKFKRLKTGIAIYVFAVVGSYKGFEVISSV